MKARALLLAALLAAIPAASRAQGLDMSHGGPVEVTAAGGIDWDQKAQTVIAHGDARAVRGNVTVLADTLTAYYRKKHDASGAEAKPPAPDAGSLLGGAAGGTEIYRLVASGHVRIHTQTDYAQGDKAVYDMDQAVLVLTGRNLRLITPQDTLTARDSLEYWSQKRMAVGRGNAVVVTNDGKRLAADVLVGYTAPPAAGGKPTEAARAGGTAAKPAAGADPLATSGKLQKVEAFGHVEIRTPTEIVHGDRGIYVPDTGIARLFGDIRITRGPNELTGDQAEVNLKTGVARLLSTPGERVEGLVMPETGNAPGGTATNPPQGGQPGGRR